MPYSAHAKSHPVEYATIATVCPIVVIVLNSDSFISRGAMSILSIGTATALGCGDRRTLSAAKILGAIFGMEAAGRIAFMRDGQQPLLGAAILLSALAFVVCAHIYRNALQDAGTSMA